MMSTSYFIVLTEREIFRRFRRMFKVVFDVNVLGNI